MEQGDIMGHEFMGEIVEVGPEVKNRRVGDRVVVAFPISCGQCFFCKKELYSLCENTNPNAWLAEKFFGHSPAGIYGYSHLTGGFAGGQAEYVRVPFADIGTVKIENGFTDEQVLFLSDIFPTGYMAAEQCNIQSGDTVAIWGCGPVGQFAVRSAFLLGAERVIAIDRFPERLQMARDGGAETINYEETDVYDMLMQRTGGRGPDSCMDAVGLEAHMPGPLYYYDRLKQAVMSESDRPIALRQAIMACRNGNCFSAGSVRRVDRQDADGRGHEQGAHHQDRSDPCTAVFQASSRPYRRRGYRSELCRDASHEAVRRPRWVRSIQPEAGRLHQNRDEAVMTVIYCSIPQARRNP
jgi:threonine dehydrogenase-like Zn-dependent dehydrogenase